MIFLLISQTLSGGLNSIPQTKLSSQDFNGGISASLLSLQGVYLQRTRSITIDKI